VTSTAPARTALRLAVVGDTHYTNPAYHRRTLAGDPETSREAAGAHRHLRSTREALPWLIEDVRAARPDLVVQLGDTIQGHNDDVAGNQAELVEGLDFLRRIGRPLLFARGTHEGPTGGPADDVYRQHYLREIDRTLGEPPGTTGTSYALSVKGCRLIVLDYTTFQPGGAADHLLVEQLALGARRGERVLLFGHPPLVPTARPFFSRLEYAATVLARLSEAPVPVDAYFCGHTHNQSVSWHRVPRGAHPAAASVGRPPPPTAPAHTPADGDWWLPQLKGVPVGIPQQRPIPLEWVRPILPPSEDVRYEWGFLQGSYAGWFLVDVAGTGVRAQWRPIGAPPALDGGDPNATGEVAWEEAGRPGRAVPPPPVPRAAAPAWPIRPGDGRVTAVRLRAAGTGSNAPLHVRLNGRDVGVLGALQSFNAYLGMAVPDSCWGVLGPSNELLVEPTAAEERCLGGFVLEVTLRDGSVVRSQVSPEWYATADTWDSWQWATPGLRHVSPVEPLRIRLDFVD
jgi:hypothetical protein